MNNYVNVGVIGTGSIATDQHIPAIQASRHARFHSLLSRSKDRGQKVVDKFQGTEPATVYDTLEAFLSDDDLDLVVVASPDFLHVDHSLASLRAGKHILVEKPLALSVGDSQRIKDTAGSLDLKFATGFHLRWHEGIRKAVSLIASGEIGTIRHVSMLWTFQRHSTDDWRADPNMSKWWSLAGVGAHCFDILNWIADTVDSKQTESASVAIRGVLGSQNEETTCLSISYENKFSAQVTTSVLFASQSHLNIYGDAGHVLCSDVLSRDNPGTVTLNGQHVPYEMRNPFHVQIDEFCASVLGDQLYEVPTDAGIRVIHDLEKLA